MHHGYGPNSSNYSNPSSWATAKHHARVAAQKLVMCNVHSNTGWKGWACADPRATTKCVQDCLHVPQNTTCRTVRRSPVTNIVHNFVRHRVTCTTDVFLSRHHVSVGQSVASDEHPARLCAPPRDMCCCCFGRKATCQSARRSSVTNIVHKFVRHRVACAISSGSRTDVS